METSKLILTYEKNIEKRELTFRGETYDFSMIPNDFRAKADKPNFTIQYTSKYLGILSDEEVIEALETLSFEKDEDGIFEQLSILGNYE